MEKIFSDLYSLIEESVTKCRAEYIALSGGLDSTIIGFHLKDKKKKGISIITKDFVGTDLTFCQLVAKKFGILLDLMSVNTEDLLSGIEQTIKILRVFNNIEIRNSVVMYLALQSIKEKGYDKIITGDGADELFAGYSFFLHKKPDELEKDLKRIWSIMHFPSKKIGEELGITVETPFLNKEAAEFSKNIPVNLKVKNEGGKKYGKWVLRKTYEKKIPNTIVWREKSPMQDGAGTSGLINLFNSLISDEVYENRKKQIQKEDNVIIQSKESLHYYDLYRKFYKSPIELHNSSSKCPYCQFQVEPESKFCRMCGSFPI